MVLSESSTHHKESASEIYFSRDTSVANISYKHSSVAIDDLYYQLDPHSHIGVACLYADYKDQSNQTLEHILGSFLCQFLVSAPPIPEEVVKKLDSIRHQHKKVEIDDILTILKIRLHQFKRIFICIDAVDELEPKVLQQLLNVLKGFVSSDTRLFLTGRGHIESEIRKYFNIAQAYTAIISATEQDIKAFVEQQITDDLNSDAMDEMLAKDIVDTIISKSQGM